MKLVPICIDRLSKGMRFLKVLKRNATVFKLGSCSPTCKGFQCWAMPIGKSSATVPPGSVVFTSLALQVQHYRVKRDVLTDTQIILKEVLDNLEVC